MKLNHVRLRYYTRFKGEEGHLRALVQYKKSRKYITTPFLINRTQLPKLDTAGRINVEPGNIFDAYLNARLTDHAALVRFVAVPLAQAGVFDKVTSAELVSEVSRRLEMGTDPTPDNDATAGAWRYNNGELMTPEDIYTIRRIYAGKGARQ